MKLWISILSLAMWGQASHACSFKKNNSQVYSLSGPLTVGLKEIGLLGKLKGVSVFNPISRQEFKGEFLPGGVFLSHDHAQKLKGSLIFFDESRELSRMFKSLGIQAVEVKTRGLLPLETIGLLGKKLRDYTEGCEDRIKQLRMKSEALSLQILKLIPKSFEALFFLGAIKQGRPPELLIVEDGIVKWLKKEGKLKTYPSELAYVSWSAKILQELFTQTVKIGVIDSAGEMSISVKRDSGNVINFTYPGSLVPGLSQLEAWNFLLKEIGHRND